MKEAHWNSLGEPGEPGEPTFVGMRPSPSGPPFPSPSLQNPGYSTFIIERFYSKLYRRKFQSVSHEHLANVVLEYHSSLMRNEMAVQVNLAKKPIHFEILMQILPLGYPKNVNQHPLY